jgi:DNA-binding transcriptional regulator YiaG
MLGGCAQDTQEAPQGQGSAVSLSGAGLKRTRELLRLSQARMARDMNLPLRWVQDLEQGRNGMTAAVRLLLRTLELFPDAVKQAARSIRDEDEAEAGEASL